MLSITWPRREFNQLLIGLAVVSTEFITSVRSFKTHFCFFINFQWFKSLTRSFEQCNIFNVLIYENLCWCWKQSFEKVESVFCNQSERSLNFVLKFHWFVEFTHTRIRIRFEHINFKFQTCSVYYQVLWLYVEYWINYLVTSELFGIICVQIGC